jgi:hypothetical protein
LEDLGVDCRILLEWLVDIGWEDAKWTDLAQYRDKWLTVVKTVMNIGVLRNAENFLILFHGVSEFVG